MMRKPEFESSRLGNTHVIINAKAGAALNADGAALEDYIREQLGAAATSLQIDLVEPDKIVSHLEKAIKAGCETLVVAGGDGSVCAAANQVIGKNVSIGLIPLGTANLMARDLGIPVTYREAIDALLTAEPTPVDVARVNGRIFLCSSLLGLPSALPKARQDIRGGTIVQRIRGYMGMAATILRHSRNFRVRIDDGDGMRQARLQMAIISNNPYDDSQMMTLARPSLATGRLGLYVMKHESTAAAFWLLLRAFVGSKPRDRNFERRTTTRVVIEGVTRSYFDLSNDGEVERFQSPLIFEIEPKAITMLKPSQQST